MRFTLVLLVVLLAGCASTSSPPTPAPSGVAPSIQLAHDYSKAEETLTFQVNESARGAFHLAFDGIVAGTTLAIDVKDPSGASVVKLEIDGKTVSPGATEMKSANKEHVLQPGTWSVAFTGTAASGTGRVELKPSSASA